MLAVVKLLINCSAIAWSKIVQQIAVYHIANTTLRALGARQDQHFDDETE